MNLYHPIPTLEKTGLVQAATSIRHGGVSRPPYHSLNLANHVGDDSEAVSTNRGIFFDLVGLELPCGKDEEKKSVRDCILNNELGRVVMKETVQDSQKYEKKQYAE